MSQIDFSKALDFLSAVDSVLITCHTRCDGDSLGSAVALANILQAKGKSAEIILPSPLPSRYAFLFTDKNVGARTKLPQTTEPQLFCIVCCGQYFFIILYHLLLLSY